jgi:transcriptional regulator with XRE-family HTH domain
MLRSDDMDDRLSLRQRLGSRLRSLRQERGWSIEEACLRIGCSRSYYYKIEAGQADCSIEMLATLAREFRLDVVDLFTFPDAALRHSIYDVLRTAPEPVLLRTKLFVLEELEGVSKAVPSTTHGEPQPGAAHRRKRAAR